MDEGARCDPDEVDRLRAVVSAASGVAPSAVDQSMRAVAAAVAAMRAQHSALQARRVAESMVPDNHGRVRQVDQELDRLQAQLEAGQQALSKLDGLKSVAEALEADRERLGSVLGEVSGLARDVARGGMPSSPIRTESTSFAERQSALDELAQRTPGGRGDLRQMEPFQSSGPTDTRLQIKPTDTSWWNEEF